jgi:hypothetical protein
LHAANGGKVPKTLFAALHKDDAGKAALKKMLDCAEPGLAGFPHCARKQTLT